MIYSNYKRTVSNTSEPICLHNPFGILGTGNADDKNKAVVNNQKMTGKITHDANNISINGIEEEIDKHNEDAIKEKYKEYNWRDKVYVSIIIDAALQIDITKLRNACYKITASLRK